MIYYGVVLSCLPVLDSGLNWDSREGVDTSDFKILEQPSGQGDRGCSNLRVESESRLYTVQFKRSPMLYYEPTKVELSDSLQI